jgi:hypothetical protein
MELMILDSQSCPANPDEVAEAYIMGTLSSDGRAAFEDHYIGCNLCAQVLHKTAEYVASMRAAAKKLCSESPGSAAAAQQG